MAKGTLRVNGVLIAEDIHKIVQESGDSGGGGTGVGDEILLETGFHILTEASANAVIQANTGDNIVIREDDGTAVLTVDTNGRATFTGDTHVGTDDVGHDVKFHGATAGSYMLWDESADDLIIQGGNVGIGTTAPSDQGTGRSHLHIHSASTDYSYIGLTNNTSGADAASHGTNLLSDGNDFKILNRESGGHIILTTTGTGKVGIGTTAPQGSHAGSVTILGDADNTNFQALVLQNNNWASTETGQSVSIDMQLNRGGSTNAIGAQLLLGKDNDYDDTAAVDAKFSIKVAKNDSLNERLRINSEGAVSLGLYDPIYGSLQVYRSDGANYADIVTNPSGMAINISGDYTNNRYTGIYCVSSAANNATKTKFAHWITTDTTNGITANWATTSNYANGVTRNDLTIKYDGKVGIGTATPQNQLHVSNTGSTACNIRVQNDAQFFTFGTVEYSSADQFIIYSGQAGANRLFLTSAGNLTVTGTISGTSKSFKIDHPLESKTDTHDLVHSSIEGPQADNIYRGKVTLVAGKATVNIDTVSNMTEGTFIALNTNTQCFTTNETGWELVKGSVSGNILTITAKKNTSTDTISWLVVGERQDQTILNSTMTDSDGKVIVEPLKNAG